MSIKMKKSLSKNSVLNFMENFGEILIPKSSIKAPSIRKMIFLNISTKNLETSLLMVSKP